MKVFESSSKIHIGGRPRDRRAGEGLGPACKSDVRFAALRCYIIQHSGGDYFFLYRLSMKPL